MGDHWLWNKSPLAMLVESAQSEDQSPQMATASVISDGGGGAQRFSQTVAEAETGHDGEFP